MAGRGGKKGKKGANGYKLPEPIPQGEILTDLSKKQWIIGKSIGIGGFGEIYSAAPYTSKTPKDYPAVIKIEPHGNGPLFVEMHFYMRNAKPDDISTWKKKKKIQRLGMPEFIGSGSHECHGIKYRFVIMERYGTDLWKLFIENNRKFPEHTVYKLAIQIIDILEYIHSKTYVHGDIKGANLLLDLKNKNQIYLVDFGLASHYSQKLDYKTDPKKAHNGTIEYTSRDAHIGVPTMRGDFEILGYNIIQWLCGELPWEKNLKDPVAVQKLKEKAFDNIDLFLNNCFNNRVPLPVSQYMKLLADMKFNDTPNYVKYRQLFEKALEKIGDTPDGKLIFTNDVNVNSKVQKESTPRRKKKAIDDIDLDNRRKSPRIKKLPNPNPRAISLDESTLGIVVDRKREKLRDMKKMLDDISDDSDTEYDIQIVKKKKKNVEEEIKKQLGARRGRKKIVDKNSDSEPEVMPKGTRSRQIPRAKKILRSKAVDSDEDIFGDY
ncbi:hypothetical protein PV326_000324 [Microctonus aethiopoides]|nr:hypothetical protein PV326_000324 [Microctonus aethiopoides]